MRNNRQAKNDATKKSSAAQSTKPPSKPQARLSREGHRTIRAIQLLLSVDARKTLRALARQAEQSLTPDTRRKLRAFAKTHACRKTDVLRAAVLITAVNLGQQSEAA